MGINRLGIVVYLQQIRNSMYWKPEVYKIENAGSVFSPGLLIFSDLVKQNLVEMIRIAGDPNVFDRTVRRIRHRKSSKLHWNWE